MLETVTSVHGALQERLASPDLDLPVLPQVATQVLAMVDDEKASAARLSALVHGDLALAARLLATANTVAYGSRAEIVSLQQAVARLGMNGVKEVVVSLCVKSSVYELKGHEEEMQLAWRQSLASGGFGKEIARKLRLNVEQAYLCGLLHEVGKPVTIIEIAKIEKSSGLAAGAAVTEALSSEFSCPFGTLIAQKWGLPSAVLAAITHFRDHRKADEHHTQVAITALADFLAHQLLDEDGPEEEDVRAHPAVADLNLYPEDVDTILAEGEGILERVEALAS